MQATSTEVAPRAGPGVEELLRALESAVLAPSSHNSQPWRFRVRPWQVELHADRTRALPVVDPWDRALTLSCGAALHHLTLALRAQGLDSHVNLLPDPSDRDLLARAQVTPGGSPTEAEGALFAAIPKRHTSRLRYLGITVPDEAVAALKRAAEESGAYFLPLAEEEARVRLAALVMEGDRLQWSDPRFRRELAAWLRPNHGLTGDGMPGYLTGQGDLAALFAPLAVRTFDLGTGHAARDRDLVDGSPLLGALVTDEDAPRDWLRAGQALSAVLLAATVEGLSASFLNQPVEVPELRPQLREVIGRQGHTQVILRLGYGAMAPASPRRPVREVLLG